MEVQSSLKEKNILIVGPLTSTIQQLVHLLTQQGADCVLIDNNTQLSSKFCSQISDQREVNPKFGRAIALECHFNNIQDIKDAVGKAAQSFGGIDAYIDNLMINSGSKSWEQDTVSVFDEMASYQLRTTYAFTTAILPFFKNRKKGRIIYLMNESHPNWSHQDLIPTSLRSSLIFFAQGLSNLFAELNVTVNCLTLGLTEEYILGQFPGVSSIRDVIVLLKERDPSIRITESERVAQAITFLISKSGIGITGQNLKIN